MACWSTSPPTRERGTAGGGAGAGLFGNLLGAGQASGPSFHIRNVASRKLLANPQGSRDNGTRIIQWDDDGGAVQRWMLQRGPNGFTQIVNAASGKVLADPQASLNDGTEIIQWDASNGPEQEWNLEQGGQGAVRIRNVASRKLLANPQRSRDNVRRRRCSRQLIGEPPALAGQRDHRGPVGRR